MAGYADKPWTPKFWLGMKCSAWLRIIAQNRFALDTRFAFPDTYACFAPNHFLVTHKFITPWLKRLMPKIRPTNNMATGFDHPQEVDLNHTFWTALQQCILHLNGNGKC